MTPMNSENGDSPNNNADIKSLALRFLLGYHSEFITLAISTAIVISESEA